MGPVSRGIQVLEALGGGTLFCAKPYAWAAEARGLRTMRCGWKDLPSGDVAIFDGRPPGSAEVVLALRASRFLVLRDNPPVEWLRYVRLVDVAFSPADLGPGVVQVPPLVLPLDVGGAVRWWAGNRPRILVVQAGMGIDEAICLAEGVRRAGFEPRVCSPWWANTRYWPASDLIATADVVISGAGSQTRAECQQAGVPQIALAMRGGEQEQRVGRIVPDFKEAIRAALDLPRDKALTFGNDAPSVESGATVIARYIREAV
jgi:hypothetical protein